MTSKTEPASPAALPFRDKRVEVRFHGTRHKRIPISYIGLDEAIDRFGRKKYPQSWGRSEVWKDMPLIRFTLYDIDQLGRLVFSNLSTNFIIRVNPLFLYSEPIERVLKIYENVCLKISEGLQQGVLSGYSLEEKDGQLSKPQPGVWATQFVPIFYTGLLVEEDHNGADRLRQIVIAKKVFHSWLKSLRKIVKVDISDELISEMINVFVEYRNPNSEKIIYTRNFLIRVVSEACRISKKVNYKGIISEEIYQRLRKNIKKDGRPNKQLAKNRDLSENAITIRLKDVIIDYVNNHD